MTSNGNAISDRASVVVIGGGITGTVTAYELARAGVDLILVERFGFAAMASGWTLAGVRQSCRHPAELPLALAAVERPGRGVGGGYRLSPAREHAPSQNGRGGRGHSPAGR